MPGTRIRFKNITSKFLSVELLGHSLNPSDYFTAKRDLTEINWKKQNITVETYE